MKCILGKVYSTIYGKEFIPILFEKGKIAKNFGLRKHIGHREEGIYIDKDGNRMKKSKLIELKK